MRGGRRKDRWAAWSLCGALVVVGDTLPIPCLRADAPAEDSPAPSGGEARPQRKQARSRGNEPAGRSAKAPVKDSSNPAKKRENHTHRGSLHATGSRHHEADKPARSLPRTPKAHEEQGLDAAAARDDACHAELRKLGVSFVKVAADQAPNVRLPIRLTGSVAGVEIRGAGRNKATSYLDCRLALALLRWAPQLKTAGVTRIDHYSIYRHAAVVGAGHKLSGHATALAIDAARFYLSDGRVLTVLDTWRDKTKGADPCAPRPAQSADEHLLRELVCDAARRDIFQTVVTPHHNAEHDNHVHLEVSSSLTPAWMH